MSVVAPVLAASLVAAGGLRPDPTPYEGVRYAEATPSAISATTGADRVGARPRRHLTVAFTGDTLLHRPLVDQALRNGDGATYDFAPMFAEVASELTTADLAICHLETPVAPEGEALSTAPIYGVPANIAAGLATAGFDRCSTASNHSLDRGLGGVAATVTALSDAGLGQSGMARSAAEAVAPVVVVGGVAIVHLSYSFGFNGLHRPPDAPWSANLIDAGAIVADAADARARGADVVIVSLHWGVEKVVDPTAAQRDVASVITASGLVDLVVGHHAHVLQPIEMVNGRWVVFGLGNFLSNMHEGDGWPASSQDGAIVEVTIDERDDHSFHVGTPVVVPTWVDRNSGWLVRPVAHDLADPTVAPGVKAQLNASLMRTAAVLGEFIAA